jgi:hypothetical protein
MNDMSPTDPSGPLKLPEDERPSGPGESGTTGSDRLTEATMLLRQHTDTGWKAMEASVLARALRFFRPSAPVRARHEHGDFFVASDVVVSRLRLVIDAVPQAAAQSVTCTVDDGDVLQSVTIQLVVVYGAKLVEVADRVHTVAWDELVHLLGDLAPGPEEVHTHVHIGDVSDDPRIVT